MHDLTLAPGPRLVRNYWKYDDALGKGQWLQRDVTGEAAQYLFSTVELAPEVTLADIFALLEQAPLLKDVFRRDYAHELCEEAAKGGVAPGGELWERIEYIELYQAWALDTYSGELSGSQHFSVHGVGPVLDKDVKSSCGSFTEHAAGTCIQWSISMTSVRELLSLPVRVNPLVSVTEDDTSSRNYGAKVREERNSEITLGTLIHSLLWEVSWHGSPEQTAQVLAEMRETVESIEQGTVETVSSDDFFDSLHEKIDGQRVNVYEQVFKDVFGKGRSALYLLLRDLPDDDNIQEALAQLEGERLEVREEYASLSCRALRRKVQELDAL